MSRPPGHREFTQQELAWSSQEAARRADQRTVNLEARLAQSEARIAEQDRTISELSAGFHQAHETLSALSVVVRELQEIGTKGVEQVLLGFEQRASAVEQRMTAAENVRQYPSYADEDWKRAVIDLINEERPRGRPKGSKNKPKADVPEADPAETS